MRCVAASLVTDRDTHTHIQNDYCNPPVRVKNNMRINVIYGGFGSTWVDNFYMGMQNGSKLEI